jgi:hypothetical protein
LFNFANLAIAVALSCRFASIPKNATFFVSTPRASSASRGAYWPARGHSTPKKARTTSLRSRTSSDECQAP